MLAGYDKRKLLLLLVFSLLVIHSVAAQNLVDTIQNIPVLQNLTVDRLEEIYDQFWWLWDFIVFMLILTAAVRLGAERAGLQNAGRMGGVIAVVLSIGAVFAENAIGFNLKEIAPLALAIAVLGLGLWIWRTINGLGLGRGGRLILALLYLTFYAMLSPRLQGLRDTLGSMNWIFSIIDILALVFVVLLVIDLINMVRGLRGGGGGAPPAAVRRAEAREAAEDEREARVEAEEETEEHRRERLESEENAVLDRIRGLSFRLDRDWQPILQDFDDLLEALSGARPTTNLSEFVMTKLAHVRTLSDNIRSVEGARVTATRRLDALENVELSELKKTLGDAKDALQIEIQKEIDNAKNQKGKDKWEGRLNNLTHNWADHEMNFMLKEQRIVTSNLSQTRTTLETHINQIIAAERQFLENYDAAYESLRTHNIGAAIIHIRAAREAIVRASQINRYAESIDIRNLKLKIRRSYDQTRIEGKLAGMLKMRLAQSAKIAKGAVRRVVVEGVIDTVRTGRGRRR